MCHDRSWFIAQDRKADDRKAKDRRNETVGALLRDSNEQAQKSRAEPAPAKAPAPAK
ncbi:MAG TPA: hypothetical protein VHN20_14955 [Beijerinckiaceae bacterium]|nr:hypothetical protein [Beijerinckiaceae bacterium]